MPHEKEYQVKEHQLFISEKKLLDKLEQENELSQHGKRMFRKIRLITALSSPLRLWQDFLYEKKIRAVTFENQAPTFILGHWRSGTTHLQYLLSLDKRFAYLENFQAFFFRISQFSGPLFKPFVQALMPRKRPQDNIKIDAESPAEEEQPLANLTDCTGMMSFFFPQNRSYFDKFNIFKGISSEEKKEWQKQFVYLLQNISFYGNNKPLLLKNPHNTGRIKELLELFPEAKFIHIHRNPYDVYRSNIHLYKKTISTQFLQDFSDQEIHERVMYCYEEMMQKYVEEQSLIPKENFFQLSYRELSDRPLETIGSLYQNLKLADFADLEDILTKYLATVKDYKANKFHDLEASTVAEINDRWSFAFEEFNYTKR